MVKCAIETVIHKSLGPPHSTHPHLVFFLFEIMYYMLKSYFYVLAKCRHFAKISETLEVCQGMNSVCFCIATEILCEESFKIATFGKRPPHQNVCKPFNFVDVYVIKIKIIIIVKIIDDIS